MYKNGTMKTELKKLKISTFIILTVAGIINAFGVTIFLFPVKLYDSGISGLSMLLDQVTPEYLTLSVFLLALNIPIFIFGLKNQGLSFTIYSIFTVGIYSLMSYLIMNVFPIDVSFVSPLAGSDLLLCAIFGGLISGIGSGLTIRFGGAIVYFIINHFQINKLKQIVHEIDKSAFISLQDVSDIIRKQKEND